jgi:hypothetical protein
MEYFFSYRLDHGTIRQTLFLVSTIEITLVQPIIYPPVKIPRPIIVHDVSHFVSVPGPTDG